MSVESNCQTDLKAIVLAIGLAGIPDSSVKIRMMPKVGEVLDTVPCVLICPAGKARPNTSEPFGFEGAVRNTYHEELLVVSGFSGDFSTDTALVQGWHEQILKAAQQNTDGSFRVSLPSASSVFGLEIDGAPTFDRDLLNTENYVYMTVEVKIHSSE